MLHPLKGSLVRLRAPEPEDLEWFYQWENQPDIWLASDTLVPFSRYHLRRYLETIDMDPFKSRQIRFMIECTDESSTQPVGSIDLFDFDPHNSRAGVGILIGSKKNRGKGYASDALQTLLVYCRQVLMLHQLYCHVQVSNSASIKMFGKNGFEKAGVLHQWIKTPDGWEDEYCLQIILRP